MASAEYEANAQSQPTLLDLGRPSPNATFTAVVYGENRAKFGTPETSLRGKRICVTGEITDYQGKPEIVLTDPSQCSNSGRRSPDRSIISAAEFTEGARLGFQHRREPGDDPSGSMP